MSSNAAFERLIVAVMADEAAGGYPDQAIDQILSTTSRMRPEPRWLVLLKERPMRISSRVAAGSPAYRRVLIVATIVALVLAVAGAFVAGTSLLRPKAVPLPAPFGAARNGAFVYEVDGDIYSADATGEHGVAIVPGPTRDTAPLFSRDGSKFVFQRAAGTPGRHQLMVANADGTGVHAITDPLPTIDWYDWSPDGSQLAMINLSERGGRVVSVVQTDTQAPLRTLDLGQVQPADWAAWRPPEGKELIFRGYPDSSDAVALYSIGADGSGLKPLAPAVTPDPAGSGTYSGAEISSDGSTIGYWSWRPMDAGGPNGVSYLLEIGSQKIRVVPTQTDPVFTPDGKSIIGEGDSQLVIEPADGSQPGRPIGPKYSFEKRQGYEVSPDGSKVILAMKDPAQTWIIDVATGNSVEMAQPFPALPSWQRLAP